MTLHWKYILVGAVLGCIVPEQYKAWHSGRVVSDQVLEGFHPAYIFTVQPTFGRERKTYRISGDIEMIRRADHLFNPGSRVEVNDTWVTKNDLGELLLEPDDLEKL